MLCRCVNSISAPSLLNARGGAVGGVGGNWHTSWAMAFGMLACKLTEISALIPFTEIGTSRVGTVKHGLSRTVGRGGCWDCRGYRLCHGGSTRMGVLCGMSPKDEGELGSRRCPPSPLETVMDVHLTIGRCVGVHLPASITPEVVDAARLELLREEISFCQHLPETAQLGFIGGRLAIRRALNHAGREIGPILKDTNGAPLLPPEVAGSISHKSNIAVAVVQPGCDGRLGVDIEQPTVRRRPSLQRRVLTSQECLKLGGVEGLIEEEEVLLRFSLKEAVYKAVHPFLLRHIGFKEIETHPFSNGECKVILGTEAKQGWKEVEVEAGWAYLSSVLDEPFLLSYAKARSIR
ncbi:unnamed protein product [Choristocarpus tenellus]